MRAVIVVPTYQEAANVERFLAEVRTAVPEAHVLVVDDASPDGTGRLAEGSAKDLGQIEVLHRLHKDGLGAAYRAGFTHVLERDHDVVVQMDCDFSHDPTAIKSLIDQIRTGADCAVGSRYVPGGSTPNWPLHRKLLSRCGNRYTSAVLGLDIADATSGFRAYRAQALRAIDVASTRSSGYAFMSEIAHRMVEQRLTIREVPITFVDRTEGKSKMSAAIIIESMALVSWNALRARVGRLAARSTSR